MVDAVSLLGMAQVVRGITITPTRQTSTWAIAAAAAMVLGIVNLIVRPLILSLALPFGFFVIFLVGFFLNGIALMIASYLLPLFTISNWLVAFIGAFVFSLINTILTNFMTIDDDDSFYQYLVEQRAKRQQIFDNSEGPTQGLLMLEIDGLSYFHIKKALALGYMPTLKKLIDEQGYKLHRVETGLPSMTTSCQAGILYGNNFDIPSFRWYDRDLGRFIVSQLDAPMLDQRYARGQGLVRGGSSIGNMLNGDAKKSLFVVSNFREASTEEQRQRANDLYLMMLDPYFFVRTIILFIGDALMEIFQYLRQVVAGVKPRLNRLAKGYPLTRAALTSFLKDVTAYLIILDIVRGTPALYHTYAGYDEMAHHAGPWSRDAFHELRRFDKVIGRLIKVVQEKAPRPYELIILSDHGQSFGATFLQRYGLTLQDFIQSKLPEGTGIASTAGGDDGSTGVISMMNELDNIQDQAVGGVTGRTMLRQANRLVKRSVDQRLGEIPTEPADVKVAFSGNLANIYFSNIDHRARVQELNAMYPGIVDALVNHPGIGFVVGLDDDEEQICFGKNGARNLCTGDLTGEDPLMPYARYPEAPVELRAEQVLRLAEFPHAGDLIVNSPIYPDGTVCAYEELIGNHGGIGGEQTDAFLLAPGDLEVPQTKNSTDIFEVLNMRRDLAPKSEAKGEYVRVDPWSAGSLWEGLTQWRTWFALGAYVMIFDRSAFQGIAVDPYMTGPAILIALLGTFLPWLILGLTGPEIFFNLAVWLLVSIMAWLAGRALGSRQDFTPLLRITGFIQINSIWLLLGLIPGAIFLAQVVTLLVTFLSGWMGVSIALKLSGWKAIFLPVIAVILTIFGFWALGNIIQGVQVTIDILLTSLGMR